MTRPFIKLLLFLSFFPPAAFCAAVPGVSAPPERADGAVPAFVHRGDEVEKRYRVYVADLSGFHDRLLPALKTYAPDLVHLLSPEPPKPLPYGYQMLPTWGPDLQPASSARPEPVASVSYSWKRTEGFIEFDAPRVRAASEKLARLPEPGQAQHAALQELAAEYVELEKNQLLIDQHVQYNRFWQKAIADDPARFNRETELHDAVLERQGILARLQKTDLPGAERLRLGSREKDLASRIHDQSDPAVPRFLQAKRTRHGWMLRVRIYSDITDARFLAAAKRAIESHWRIRDGGELFQIQVEIRKIDPRRLYRSGAPPPPGTHIDVNAHADRFPEDGGVLTTGASSLHVRGRAIALGTAELTPRTLAHEFGHLLGFRDGYFRGYRDRGEEGYEVLEVVPDPEDIMCSPGAGNVLPSHFTSLLKALRKSGN